MNAKRLISAVAAASLLAFSALAFSETEALAVGQFFGLPNATSPLTGNECIPADTNLGQGLTPTTECVTPGQLGGISDGNALNNYSNIPIGSVAYGSLGTNTADINGQFWISSITLPLDFTSTGLKCLAGGTATTDNVLAALFSSTGARLANSATAGVLLAGANTFQTYNWTAPIALKAGFYFIAVQGNGTAAGAIRTIAASTYIGVATKILAGTFGTVPATIVVPTTFVADSGPICFFF